MQAGAAGQPNTPFISPKTWIQGYADIKKKLKIAISSSSKL
jgi:hypothetical protein